MRVRHGAARGAPYHGGHANHNNGLATGAQGRDMKAVRTLAFCAFAIVGTVAGAIVLGTAEAPAPMRSVVDVAKAVDRTGMPELSHYPARDGTLLAYRAYPVPGSTQVALLFHGSSDSSMGMHAVAKALQQGGVSAYALDIRGHGGSGVRGDIHHVGQLEEDVVDGVTQLRRSHADARFFAVGHSSGGGFALRLAGTPATAELFDGFVATAPYLHYRAVTSRGAEGGGWARPFKPRIVALTALEAVGLDALGGLPVIAFALPPEAPGTRTYSYRLFRNYGPHTDFVDDVRRGDRPWVVIAGTADEVFRAEHYAQAFEAVKPLVAVQLIEGLGHMAVVSHPTALQAIVGAVQALGAKAAAGR